MSSPDHQHPGNDHLANDHDRLTIDPTSDPGGALLAAALDAAARGWAVFPLTRASKRPALHGAQRCPGTGQCAGGHVGWEQRATTCPDRIRAAWTAGVFNIGIACGPSRLVVIDLDRPNPDDPRDAPPAPWARLDIHDGADVLAALAEQARQPVPATFTVATPSGGRHLYYRAPGGPGAPALRNTTGDRGHGLGWKVDTRAHGGYVVAPGSRTPTGPYVLLDGRAPVELPAWLRARLRPPAPIPTPPPPVRAGAGGRAGYVAAAIEAESARVHQAPAGQRNACLYIASVALGQLVAGGALPEPDARAALLSAAGRHLALRAYSPRQAEQTITSGLRAGAKRPRTITDPTGAAA
ncbi:MAG: bifunctional DNA primase/polymerase [Pseudonocardia sp.]